MAGANSSDARRSSAVRRAYEEIREEIVSGRFEPGRALRLDALSRAIGVSVIPIREALRLLEAEGSVQITPNRGAAVSPLSVSEVLDIYRARIVVESALARGAAVAQEAVPDEATQLVQHMIDLLGQQRPKEAAHAHRRLHFALYRRAGSPWLERLAGVLWDNADRYLRHSPNLRGSLAEFGREHQAIVDAVAAGDPDAAEAALTAHLSNTASLLRDFLARPSPGPDGTSSAPPASATPLSGIIATPQRLGRDPETADE